MQASCPAKPFPKHTFISFFLICVTVILILYDLREELSHLSSYTQNMKRYFVLPDFSQEVLKQVFFALIETVEIAFLGTLIGAVFSIPLSWLASDLGGSHSIVKVIRTLLAFTRSIPLIFYGYILVSIFGLGAFPGICAMMIYTVGILSKMFFDEISNLDDDLIHVMMSTGASRFQVFWYGILPELFPNFLTFTLLRFEINVREAAILGVVGAGGLGILLRQYGTLPPYNKLWTLILTIFLVVIAIECLCNLTIKKMKM